MCLISFLVPVFGAKRADLETFMNQLADVEDAICVNFVYEADSCEFVFEDWILAKAKQLDIPVRVLTLEGRKGLGYALNKGLDFCQSEYVIRHDVGDDLLSNRIKLISDVIAKNPDIDIIYSQAELQKGDMISISDYPASIRKIRRSLIIRNPICHPTTVLKKRSIKNIGSYNERLRYCEDLDLWLRSIKAGLKFYCINIPTIKYMCPMTTRNTENWKTNLKVRLDNYSSPNMLYGICGIIIIFLYIMLPEKIKIGLYDVFKKNH